MATEKDIRATRVHPILKARAEQLTRNTMSVQGGDPYTEARLHRHPCESDASWSGKNALYSTPGTVGRKDRAYMTPLAHRITSKVVQFVFGQPIAREGIDEDFRKDADRCGCPLQELMAELSVTLDACGWGWLQADRDPLPEGGTRTVAQREASRDRVYWRVWNPVDVVDWCVDSAGRIVWLMTQGEVFDNADPAREPTVQKIRTLYIPGGGVRLYIDPKEPEKVQRAEPFTNSASEVPFVLVGCPSSAPILFDGVERIQCALLNYASAHQENLLQSVFSQLVLPASLPATLSSVPGAGENQDGLQMVRGLGHPILESAEEKGITRYIVPPSDGLKMIPEEMERLKRELFELVGMMLANPSRQVASAEAKAWDNMDPQAVLAARSGTLEDAEKRAIAVSVQLDNTFKVYEPKYPTAFDLGDVKADFESLLSLSAMDLPETAKREQMRAAVHLLNKIRKIDPVNLKVIDAEIDEHDFDGLGILSDITGAAPSAGTVADSAMNGAQVASLVEIAVQAASKGLPIETAKQIANAAFPGVDDATLDRIFAPLANFTPATPPATQGGGGFG